jgi:hypothetical protein
MRCGYAVGLYGGEMTPQHNTPTQQIQWYDARYHESSLRKHGYTNMIA